MPSIEPFGRLIAAPRGPELSNPNLHGGISVFDSLERAAAKVPILERGGKSVLGIGELRIPDGSGLGIEKTLGPGHYTLTGPSGSISANWTSTFIKW